MGGGLGVGWGWSDDEGNLCGVVNFIGQSLGGDR